MDWAFSFFAGLGTGVVLSLMLGTVFFGLINNSVNYGYKTGVSMAIGVVLSDIIFISICIFGSQFIPKIQSYENEVKIVGGCLVVLLGLSQVFGKNNGSKINYFTKAGSITYFLSQGFLLNLLNPVNLVSWFAINTYLITVYAFKKWQLINFFGGSLLAIFLMEVLLAYSAERIKNRLTDHKITVFNRIVGIIFIVCGLWLIFR